MLTDRTGVATKAGWLICKLGRANWLKIVPDWLLPLLGRTKLKALEIEVGFNWEAVSAADVLEKMTGCVWLNWEFKLLMLEVAVTPAAAAIDTGTVINCCM